MAVSVGVDVGGTFTDVVVSDSRGRIVATLKTLTTEDPALAVASALGGAQGGPPGVRRVSHATTIATNSLLTRSGLPKAALVTNRGFRDVLEIARQRRPDLYDIYTRRPEPLVPRADRFEVEGRTLADGTVVTPLDIGGADEVSRKVVKGGYETVAVCFLHSYANPSQEEEMKRRLTKSGYEGTVCLSSEVDRRYREYERTSTTVVNAVLAPRMSRYYLEFEASLSAEGVHAPVLVMNSEGDMSSLKRASSRPVESIESGPAAGVLAARALALKAGVRNALTFDMGGTTAKNGVVADGVPDITYEFEVGGRNLSGRSVRGSGYPVRSAFIDMVEVSSGGGTIARVDDGGALRVGPESAGSDPGPACYGRGGRLPTVTDANLFLGRLNPNGLLGGRMKLSGRLASESLETLSRPAKLSLEEVAVGVVRLVNDSMARAMAMVTLERGRDPREFALVAFGGAGPMHCCDLAESMGVDAVLVPLHAGLFSAYGLLAADAALSFSLPVAGGLPSVRSCLRKLEGRAKEAARAEGLRDPTVSRSVEMRYRGQSHEVSVPVAPGGDPRRAFEEAHERLFGYSTGEPVEYVNARVRVSEAGQVKPLLATSAGGARAEESERRAWVGGRWRETRVVAGEPEAGARGRGPCIIEGYDSTLVVNPGWRWEAEDDHVRLAR